MIKRSDSRQAEDYLPPVVTIIDIRIEKGFAGSYNDGGDGIYEYKWPGGYGDDGDGI